MVTLAGGNRSSSEWHAVITPTEWKQIAMKYCLLRQRLGCFCRFAKRFGGQF